MKAAIYIRVSSGSQDHEMQRADLIRYCKYHGYKFDVFEEKQSARQGNHRPELQRLLLLIKECHYDRVIVWKFDRLARSIRDLMNIIDVIESAKATLVSFKEHVDLSQASGRMMMQMIGIFAEFELSTMKDRQRAGIVMARDNGVKFGRPRKKILPRRIEIEYSKCHDYKTVAKRLGVSLTTLYKIKRGV